MTDTFPITIYHNPKCGTSRNTLAMIEAAGYAPDIVEYSKVGWTRAQLEQILSVQKSHQVLNVCGLEVHKVLTEHHIGFEVCDTAPKAWKAPDTSHTTLARLGRF
jgi:hypothetical protein